MRTPEEDIELRSLMNDILARYNARETDQSGAHTYGAEPELVEADIRYVWNTYLANGQADAVDHDILLALKSIEHHFWPKEIFLEAALVIADITGSPITTLIKTDKLNAESRFLLAYEDTHTSLSGEDGIVARIFEIIGADNSWCVEFGAWDGKRHSNTYRLVAEQDWKAVLIEGREHRFKQLEETYRGNDRVRLFNQMVGFDSDTDSIDHILGKTDIPRNPDLMVVDIDGNDWHVWNSMQTYRPRLVMIEMNPTIPNDVLYVQERDPELQRGCSLRALIDLGKSKGYELVCATSFNGLFVVAEEFEKFGIQDNSIDAMYAPVMDGRIFHGYDSSIHVIGMPNLVWDWSGRPRDWANGLPDQFTVYQEW